MLQITIAWPTILKHTIRFNLEYIRWIYNKDEDMPLGICMQYAIIDNKIWMNIRLIYSLNLCLSKQL